MKKELIVSIALASLAFGVPSLMASTVSRGKSIQKEISFDNNNFKVASKDIQKGLNHTLDAINALKKNQIGIAKKNLTDATKNFNKALKTDPKLGLVPIDESVVVYRYDGDPKNIKEAVSIAQKTLAKNDLQFTRDVLAPLKDEIDITTHYIPMDLYPNTTKVAAKLLAKGKSKEAAQELGLGLSTIVTNQVTIPIPLLASQDLVSLASKIDKSKKPAVEKLLKQAQMELQKATLLGYASKHSSEYKSLEKKIKVIQKEIKGKNKVEKLYKEIKGDFKSLVHKTRNERKKFDSNSVWNGTKKAQAEATKEENKDIVNFAQKSKTDAF